MSADGRGGCRPQNDSGSHHKAANTFSVLRVAAQGRWPEILQRLGVDAANLKNRHGPCPGCGGRDRFRFDDKGGKGTWYCSGGGEPAAGDGFALIQHVRECSPVEALRLVDEVLSGELPSRMPRRKPRGNQASKRGELAADRRRRRERLARTRAEALPIKDGDPVARYLLGRGLYLPGWPSALRHHPALPYREDDGSYSRHPAMVALISTASGHRVGLHRIYLTPDGQKAPVPNPKRLMPPAWPGATRGAGVYLGAHGPRLAVAEGIETALAFGLLSGLPACATISAGGMEALVVPDGVREVVIGADHDDAGLQAAEALAARLRSHWIAADIRVPPTRGADWCDLLQAEQTN